MSKKLDSVFPASAGSDKVVCQFNYLESLLITQSHLAFISDLIDQLDDG
jgi:hypothetical protein